MLSRDAGQPFDLLLIRFVHERFLYRLSLTPHRYRFILKGARLLAAWFPDPHRPTRDLDLLGLGDPDTDAMLAIFREVCSVAEEDAVEFDLTSLRLTRLRGDLKYGGLRLRALARMDRARVHLVVDVGFGDAVEPAAQEIELPVLLDLPAPRLRAYPAEAVVAEKFEALVMRGVGNTRLKDFYDLWTLSRSRTFEEDRLTRAIRATFGRRGPPIPEDVPDGLTREFVEAPGKREQWEDFLEDVTVRPRSLEEVTDALREFLMPLAERARTEEQREM